jgi:adenosylmethionine-8-amino-7-oxononanoate aminotransferase
MFRKRGKKMISIWYPYTQMKDLEEQYQVVKADGVYLTLANGQKLIDGICSWWCVIHGYNHPEINKALLKQAKKFSHVMLGGLSHKPAQALAEKLVQITPQGLNHVFFADSGSVGVEVALKIAMQYWVNKKRVRKNKFVALKKAYHGDTIGAMSVGDTEDGMHEVFKDILIKQYFLPAPEMGLIADMDKLEKEVALFRELIKAKHQEIAAFIVEPLMQAAGGFNFYAAEYLQKIAKICKEYEVLLIFDEVATGFGRTGALFAAQKANVTPDILILGKGLTAGYIGHAATLATTPVFEAFYGDSARQALMHGPTFMGNALACAVSLKSIEIFERENYLEKIGKIEEVLQRELMGKKANGIKDIRVCGATGVIEAHKAEDIKEFQEFAMKQGVWLKPFEKYVYTMPAYIITEEELRKITGVMKAWFGV